MYCPTNSFSGTQIYLRCQTTGGLVWQSTLSIEGTQIESSKGHQLYKDTHLMYLAFHVNRSYAGCHAIEVLPTCIQFPVPAHCQCC